MQVYPNALWATIIKSLVVVIGAHGHENLKPPEECEAVNWDRSPMHNKEYVENAVLIDHRPFDPKINATLVPSAAQSLSLHRIAVQVFVLHRVLAAPLHC